jgi:pimeloyl-ACP methyl ester carboxylesterase
MLDLRGHGDSSPSAEAQYTAAAMAADVESFVTERDLYTRPLAVVGVGLGAAVALAFAAAQPQLVREGGGVDALSEGSSLSPGKGLHHKRSSSLCD